jgi:hypothetical protein
MAVTVGGNPALAQIHTQPHAREIAVIALNAMLKLVLADITHHQLQPPANSAQSSPIAYNAN